MTVTFNEFQKPTKEEWIAKIQADLKGKKQVGEIIYYVEEGLEVSPFLTSDDIKIKSPIIGPSTKLGVIISDINSKKANAAAVQALELGAEVLSFQVNKGTDFNVLFKDIVLDIIMVCLFIEEREIEILTKLETFINQNRKDKNLEIVLKANKTTKHFGDLIGAYSSNMTFLDRLVSISLDLINYLAEGINKSPVILINLKSDYLAQISELRALRIIWANILKNLEIKTNLKMTIIVQTEADLGDIANINPMIAVNYKFMSAYLGMADICMSLPYKKDDNWRLSLNMQHIFREESYLNLVSDPLAGSYLIESLTEQMATKTWNKICK